LLRIENFKFPTIQETTDHPAYPTAIWALEATKKGLFPAAKSRGGPVHIGWEIHGEGPTKLVLVMGLAGVTASWQRQTRYFGHDRHKQYSVLVMDNRGMGESDKPLSRYSTSEMAKDVIEVLDHVGWTDPRSVNLVGISLGGMISQEIACAIPERLASLSLLCTSSSVQNTETWKDWLAERASFLVPKAAEQGIIDTARKIFVDEWLIAPDAEDPPQPETTYKCLKSGAEDGKYAHFTSNFERFQAQELTKRRHPGYLTKQGFICQLVAAQWHSKSAAQLKKMADEVGRNRIMVLHGDGDRMITVKNGQKLIEMIQPETALIEPGMGHAPVMERAKWFNELLEERMSAWGQIKG